MLKSFFFELKQKFVIILCNKLRAKKYLFVLNSLKTRFILFHIKKKVFSINFTLSIEALLFSVQITEPAQIVGYYVMVLTLGTFYDDNAFFVSLFEECASYSIGADFTGERDSQPGER